MTESEKQEIVSLVLAALKTNSFTIEQLTAIHELPEDAYLELSGGKKIACSDFVKVIEELVNNGVILLIEKEAIARKNADNILKKDIDNEVDERKKSDEAFSKVLALLDRSVTETNNKIGSKSGSESHDGSVWGEMIGLSEDIIRMSEDVSALQVEDRRRHPARFDRIEESLLYIEGVTNKMDGEVVFAAANKKFCYVIDDRAYANWPGAGDFFGSDNKIYPGKIYLCRNKAYVYWEGNLYGIGADDQIKSVIYDNIDSVMTSGIYRVYDGDSITNDIMFVTSSIEHDITKQTYINTNPNFPIPELAYRTYDGEKWSDWTELGTGGKGEKGDKGDKGDSLEFKILGDYENLEELKSAYPDGPVENGLFKVGDSLYTWTGTDYGILNLDVFRTFSLEQFTEVAVSGSSISVDFDKTPYAKVTLSGESRIFNLVINNVKDGVSGKILVFQTGFKQISVSENIKGTIDLPLNSNTIALLTYNVLGNVIYIHSSTVLGDVQFPTPQRIVDFQLVYSDSSVCTVQWSAPYANNIYDKVTEYDMRYSNSLVDADDPKVWGGLKKVSGMPDPVSPGGIQKMTVSGLSPNKEYYLYLKSVKVNYGVEYTSASSDFVYFKTTGSEDSGKAYRINLTERNLLPQLRNYNTDTDGTVCSIDKMVDEAEKNVFLDDGYPDTRNKEYTTFWSQYKYSRDTSPFDIFIDLFSEYVIDKMFVYSRSKPQFSVYGMKEQGYPWTKVGEINIGNNEWKSLDFSSFQCRFIKISFDKMDFGSASTSPAMPEGSEGFPDPEYNGTLERIDNLLLYGRPVSVRPEGIMPPLRKSTVRKTVDQFFCTNGHGYQQGRIHSMCSGERVRMYMHFGQFAANYDTPDAYSRLADMRFRVNEIGWVSGNNGTGEYLEDTLRNTYARYGLKPFLCNTGIFDYCYYDKSVSTHNRPCDNYWYPDAWKPVPRRGIGGLDKYFSVTMNAASYKTYAKMCAAVAAKYGRMNVDGSGMFYPESESTATGLDLISGIEPANEPDQNWSGWIGYTHSEEYAAMLSAACDGHDGSLTDEDGNTLSGIKGGGILAVGSGTASVNRAYYLAAMLEWKSGRKSADIPVDVFSMHMYFSNVGNQGSSQEKVQYGITFEEAMKNVTGGELSRMVELRNRFAPDKEIALTEFGWGESGGRDKSCKYQCYTQPGRKIGSWIIPDRHRSDVKGAWIVRACIQMMSMGIDFVNYYSTECESNYFGAGNWDSGAGFEMFHWNDCDDPTPGAKAEAIKAYEHSYDRGGFATTGLFGQILTNGAYPITRAYWWIATMRTRLKGYVYTGMKYMDSDSRIVVACFKKQGEDKGAYAVYLNDDRNTGVAGVEIPVPDGVASYKHVTVYVPDIPNPQDVPGNLGYDQMRTGLPTSRKERYENGRWVLVNKPYMGDKYSSYSQAPAVYPDNPREGDEITVLPTSDENPYFPIVGPVNAKSLAHGNNLSAQNYEQDREEWETEPDLDEDGNVIWTVKSNVSLAWRQVDAVCDYIDYHPDGIHGRNGDEVTEQTVRGYIQTNVSEFPEFFFFDAVPEPDYRSEITDLSSRTVSSSAVELWWNNTNTEDTGYQIFVSELPETGYTLLKEIAVDVENKAVISGLSEDTTYYYKIRPVRGQVAGTMSDYVSARTYSELPAPDNLKVESRTATSISLSWAYTNEQVADFVCYAIYRADDTGAFMQVAKVEDRSIRTYTDSGLAVGHNYVYKIRAVGLNGQSPYSPEVATRTLLAEECSPVIRTAMTDKLGTKIILTFDLPIGIVDAAAKSNFTLTEDGSLRTINYVARDEANHNNLIISVPQDTLKDYDRKSEIRISFSGGGVSSEYGVLLDAFSDVMVINVIGNFTNIEAVYQLNFCGSDSSLPDSAEWNNIVGNPESDVLSVNLTDTYGRSSSIYVSPVQKKPSYVWGSPTDSGYCELPGIPESVYKYAWRIGFGSNDSESVVARLTFDGLNDEYRYTVKAFGGTKYGSAKPAKIKVNGVYSDTVDQVGNTATYMTVEDCQPSGGVLNVDLINVTEGANTNYPAISFMIVEEFKSNDAPENKDVFLREAFVNEAVTDIVKYPDVTVHLNCIGIATAYMISENADFEGAEWVDIIDDNMDVPFTLSDGFGAKTIYVQVKNQYSESNVRVIELEYKDPYVPLVLRNVFINEDAGRTYSREVSVMIDKDGIPSHYKISESPDLSSVQWSVWPDPKASVIPFTLSEGEGQKTVYVQVMDSTTICGVKADTINYVPVEMRNMELTLTLPEGADTDLVTASFPILKYNKKFIFSYTADDGPVGAYGKVWCAVNKRWVDDEKYYHLGQTKSTGYVPEKTLGYTDGCGIERRLPIGVAIWPNCGGANKYMDDDPKSPAQYPYILWKELNPILDFGGEIYFHNIDQDTWGSDDPLKIVEGLKEDQTKTVSKLGRGMKVMMRPDGNNNYITAATMYDDLVMSFAENTPAVYLYPSDDPDLYKSVGQRRMYTDNNTSEMEWIKGIHDAENPVWAHLFTHTPMQAILDFLTEVNNAYGKDGDDSCWMATVDEVYEYWFVRRNASIHKRVDGRTVKFSISAPVDQHFHHKDLCLNIEGISSLDGITVESNDTVYGLSYGINNGRLLVNASYDEQITGRAEKYTSAFEKSLDEDDKSSAEYFIQLLKPSLRTTYLERIGAVTQPPVLTRFSLSKDVTEYLNVPFEFEASNYTLYMISENADFEGAEWDGNVYHMFTISNVEGLHTVYFKVKNRFGESEVMSDTVTYEPPAFGLNGISINSGSEITTEREVSVSFEAVGLNAPTMMMLSESPTFNDAVWTAFENPASFTLSEGEGEKTIHAKIKHDADESEVVSSKITLKIIEKKVVFSMVDSSTDNRTLVEIGGETVNTVKKLKDYEIVLAYNNGEDSEIRYYDDTDIEGKSGLYSSIENPTEPSVYDGVYSYAVVKDCYYYNEYNQPETIVPHRIIFKAPEGTYKVRILGSTKNANGANTDSKYYESNGVQAQPSFSLVNNFTDFVELDNVVPDDSGYLIIKWWGNPTRNAMTCVNLIEIIKKG